MRLTLEALLRYQPCCSCERSFCSDSQKKATDPTRFANRGGNLLKEEKQRCELHKGLPKVRRKGHWVLSKLSFLLTINHHPVSARFFKIEKKLKAQIDAWEEEQGSEFLVNGQKFLQYVEQQWELLRIEKEKEKQARVNLLSGFVTSPESVLKDVLTSAHDFNSNSRRANRPRRTCCTGQQSGPPPNADSWAPPRPTNPERC